MISTCLIGDPVEHSLSNYMYSIFAESIGIEYGHLKLRVDSQNPYNLVKAIEGIRALNFTGFNVTLPYKLPTIPLLDGVAETVKIMGAVNTVVNQNGKLIGYNTDGIGAIRSIDAQLEPVTGGDKVLLLGAGGAARAILYELLQRKADVTVLNREEDTGMLEKLHEDFQNSNLGFTPETLSSESLKRQLISAKYVINATSVGMNPNSEDSLLDEDTLAYVNSVSPLKSKLFFDAVFNPYLTKFLQQAKQFEAPICSGLYMMLYQGIESFKLWTGISISGTEVQTVHDSLKRYYH